MHFATLPIHVAPSLSARLQAVVSLGPPEGATTHQRTRDFKPENRPTETVEIGVVDPAWTYVEMIFVKWSFLPLPYFFSK